MDLAVFIGRFQPFHEGHLHVVRSALKEFDHVLILCGSANMPRSPRNPFTADERMSMISDVLSDSGLLHKASISCIPDATSDAEWVGCIEGRVRELTDELVGIESVNIVGHYKDSTSYYLDNLKWRFVEIGNLGDFHSSIIRDYFFGGDLRLGAQEIGLPPTVLRWLCRWSGRNGVIFYKLRELWGYGKHSTKHRQL